jgi:hypothetical protein
LTRRFRIASAAGAVAILVLAGLLLTRDTRDAPSARTTVPHPPKSATDSQSASAGPGSEGPATPDPWDPAAPADDVDAGPSNGAAANTVGRFASPPVSELEGIAQPFANEAEREWLERHHYAVYHSHYEFYMGLDDDDLRRMAGNDDLVAMHEWCLRVIYKHKQVEAGVECFTDLASRGSHQAIETVATAFLWGPSNVEVDYVRGQAWARVGYMLGNWKALHVANAAAVESMTPRELLLADALAASLHAELDRRHRQRTGAPIRADLRPGWLEALEHIVKHGLEEEPEDG